MAKEISPENVLKALEDYASGDGSNEIAKRYGFKGSQGMFSTFLEKHPEEYRRIQVGFALQQKEDAEQALCSANDNAVIRACEVLIKNAQWSLERLASSSYAQKRQEAQMPNVNIYIADLRGEKQPVSIQVVDVPKSSAKFIEAPKPKRGRPRKA